ncbi:hypothetical protein TNCV_57561 [Trichonephila clavipes]|nr:hypothetical protein TNCV_57561 [Trichonephila clavipes]
MGFEVSQVFREDPLLINGIHYIEEGTVKKSILEMLLMSALSGAPNENNIPGTSAASEEAPTNEKNNENSFGFNDAIGELRRFFLDYPFLLEMGRQFRNAKDEKRIDIFYQNLVNNYNHLLTPLAREYFLSLPTPSFLPSHPSSQWETSSQTNGESSSPVTDRTPSLHFPSQRLVESSPAHWPGNPRPLVERVTSNVPRSHDDPE